MITDRGRPIARLVPEALQAGDNDDGRLARLERAGVLRGPKQRMDKEYILRPLKPLAAPAGVLEALLEERATSEACLASAIALE